MKTIKFIKDHKVAWDGITAVQIKTGEVVDAEDEVATVLIDIGVAVEPIKRGRRPSKASTDGAD